ncbi:MAG: hypothetical protein NOU37_03365 [Candidatus Brocadiales bacterium]|nr:hypothetical protein [Candidatus Bathyanammoxibius amoris]
MTLYDEILSRSIWAVESIGTCSTISTLAQLSIKEHGQKVWDDNVDQTIVEKQFLESAKAATLKDSETLIPTWAFISIITTYEAWMSDILRLILREYPKKIRKEKVESSTIKDSSSYEECLERLIDEELRDIFYKGPREATKHLQLITSIDIESIPGLADIFELKTLRDILLHNKGVVNGEYLRRAGSKARAKKGEKIRINAGVLSSTQKSVGYFIAKATIMLKEKYKKTGKKL